MHIVPGLRLLKITLCQPMVMNGRRQPRMTVYQHTWERMGAGIEGLAGDGIMAVISAYRDEGDNHMSCDYDNNQSSETILSTTAIKRNHSTGKIPEWVTKTWSTSKAVIWNAN